MHDPHLHFWSQIRSLRNRTNPQAEKFGIVVLSARVDPGAAFRAKREYPRGSAISYFLIGLELSCTQLELVIGNTDHHTKGSTGMGLAVRAVTNRYFFRVNFCFVSDVSA